METALLDACVLYPVLLRDTLLRLAERGLYRVLWSPDILEEMVEAILRDRPDLDRSDLTGVVEAMREAFPDAEVTGYADLIDHMRNDPDDRHVMAAAVGGRADVIVTHNVGDFPAEACQPYGLVVRTPDAFLVDLFHLEPEVVVATLEDQAEEYRRPPLSVDELVEALGRSAPAFAELVRTRRVGERPPEEH